MSDNPAQDAESVVSPGDAMVAVADLIDTLKPVVNEDVLVRLRGVHQYLREQWRSTRNDGTDAGNGAL